MTCPVCGKLAPCAHSRRNAAVALDREIFDEGAVLPSPREVQDRADRIYWRQEIVSRVQQHRARRRRRFDADTSFELNFPAPDVVAGQAPAQSTAAQAQVEAPPSARATADQATQSGTRFSRNVVSPPAEPRKIIRFPRMAPAETTRAARPFVDELELADPAPATPRILDASEPQQMDLLAAFTDIELEEPAPDREDLGLPPQPAPLPLRVFSSIVDAVIVLAGEALFAEAFLKMSAASLAGHTAVLGGAAVLGVFWLLFQYIFLVYGRGTPGMRWANLEVCNLAGELPSRSALRSRAFALMLSALSLGLGFAWALVDEDTLGWHDRISGTYMRSSTQLR